MGRYDKIRVYNGSSWVQPSNMYVYNGSSWVDFGSNTSYNTNNAYMYNGSAWVRSTLNRQDYTTYNAATERWVEYTGANNLSFVNNGITLTANRQASSWSAWFASMAKDYSTGWWAGSTANNDGTLDTHEYTWSGNLWISKMTYRSPGNNFFQACPHVCSAQFRTGTTWSATQSYTTNVYTNRDQWNNGWAFNKQGSYTGVRLSFYNNSSYKEIVQSTRVGRYSLLLGTMGTGTNWI